MKFAGSLAVLVSAPAMLFPGAMTPFAVALLSIWVVGWSAKQLAQRSNVPIRGGFPPPPLVFALAAATLASATLGTILAFDRAYALPKLLVYLLGISCLVVCATMDRPGRQRAVLLSAIPLLGAAIALVAALGTSWLRNKSIDIVALANLLPSFSGQAPRSVIAPPGGFGFHPNEVAGTMALFLAFGSAVVTSRDRRVTPVVRTGAAIGMAMCGAVVVLTQSRSGLVAALTGIGLSIFASLAPRLFSRVVPILIPAVIGVVLVTFSAFVLRPVTGVQLFDAIDRASFDSGSGAGRWSLWDRSFEMIRDHWLTGIGLNTFPFVLDTQYPNRETIAPTLSELQVAHAHNIVLQTVLDLGVPGAISVASLTALAFVSWLKRRGGISDPVSDGAASAVVTFLAFGVTDAIALGAKPSVLFFACLGMMLVPRAGETPLWPALANLRTAVPTSMATVATAFLLFGAITAYSRGDWRPAEWRTLAAAVDGLAEPTDLVVINAVPEAFQGISRDMRRTGPTIAAPPDQARAGTALQGFRTVWLIDTIDAFSRPGGSRPRYWLDLRGPIIEMHRIDRAMLLKYELVAAR